MNQWTAWSVFRRVVARLREQPVRLALALLIAPALWSTPADVLRDHVVPEEAAGSLLDAIMLAATMLWATIPYGGELLISIDAARGDRVDWRRFRDGLPHTLRLAITVLPGLPLLILLYVPEGEWLDTFALPLVAAALVFMAVAGARLVLWGPLIVDSRPSRGLAASWAATRGHAWRLIRLGALLTTPALPVLVLELILYDQLYVSIGIFGALGTLAAGELYVHVLPRAAATESALTGEQSAPAEDLPKMGSGWSRPFD